MCQKCSELEARLAVVEARLAVVEPRINILENHQTPNVPVPQGIASTELVQTESVLRQMADKGLEGRINSLEEKIQ